MLDWLKTILGDSYNDDIDKKVSAEIGKDFVARTDFNTLNETKKTLETTVKDRDTQLETLKKVDPKALQDEITRLQGENTTAKTKYDADLKQAKLTSALDLGITKAKGKNATAIKALIDSSKLALKDDGSVDGLDGIIDGLKKDCGYLFEQVTTTPQGTGFHSGKANMTPEDTAIATTFSNALKG